MKNINIMNNYDVPNALIMLLRVVIMKTTVKHCILRNTAVRTRKGFH